MLELKESCCQGMFKNCKNITKSPDLVYNTLVKNCFKEMYCGCENLKYIAVNFLDWNESNNCTTNWLSGVTQLETFFKPTTLPLKYGDSFIPNNTLEIKNFDVWIYKDSEYQEEQKQLTINTELNVDENNILIYNE